MRFDTVVVFDHSYNHLLLITHLDLTLHDLDTAYVAAERELDNLQQRLEQPLTPRLTQPVEAPPLAYTSHTTQADFTRSIGRIKDYIKAGDAFQVVLSQRLSAPSTATPFQVYRSLRSLNPSPYLFSLRLDSASLVGASPELLVRVEAQPDGSSTVSVPLKKTMLWAKHCWRIQKNAPNMSCSSIWDATMSDASAFPARWYLKSRW